LSADLADVPAPLRDAVSAALDAAGVHDGHLAVNLVDEERIRKLNREHRGLDVPTDVLSFPVDAGEPVPGPRELGDVFACEAQCADLTEAVVHGVLHLCGHDHEIDAGEMLARQDAIMRQLEGVRDPAAPGGGAEEAGGEI
jgi:probable rRNA maturation factor